VTNARRSYLPATERVAILRKRLESLRAGKGEHGQLRASSIADCASALRIAYEDLQKERGLN
jgi:hypothetical protein